MTKANHDRNIVKVGTTKKDEKEWDRLEDRLQTDPNLGGGGPAELLVPGTYIPRVGLPPGIPYVYVIGGLIEGYPVDISTIGPLYPYVDFSLDSENYFGLGIDAFIGKSVAGEIRAYRIPAYPASISGNTPLLRKVISADGTLFELPYTYADVSSYLVDTIRVRETDLSWTEYSLYAELGIQATTTGEGSDVSGVVVATVPYSNTTGLMNTTYDYYIISVDKTLSVTNTQTGSYTLPNGRGFADTGIIENGWIILAQGGVSYDFREGTVWARPSVTTAAAPTVKLGNIFESPTPQSIRPANLSVGTTGILWASYKADGYGNTGGVVRFDAITGQIQRYTNVLFDNTGTYPIEILKTLYINDNTCAVSGYYYVPGVTYVPIISFVALDNEGALTVNILEFPDYSGSTSRIPNMVKLPDNTLVFQLFSENLDATGGPANILFGTTVGA